MTARLDDRHRAELEASAIAPEVIEARGYQSIMNPRGIPPQFRNFQRERAGLLIPVRDFTGEVVTYQLKPDDPRIDQSTGKPIKYETAMNAPICIDVPAAVLPHLRNVDIPLWITEGVKKVDSALSHGLPCIVGLQGIDSWTSQGVTLPDWKEIMLRGRSVVVAFDSDTMTKASARRSLERFGTWLTRQGAEVGYLVMPDLPDGAKCGLDDWFAAGGARLDLERLVRDTLPGSVMDWEDPIPLDPTTGPPFPLEALPGTIGRYVAAVGLAYQVPIDLPALVALGAISAAVGGKYTVHPAPDWTEPVHAMLMPVLRSGAKKSGVMREVTAPIRSWEADRRAADREALAVWKARNEQKRKKLEVLQRQAVKLETERPDAPETDDGKSARARLHGMNTLAGRIEELARELALDRPPRVTQIIADNVTPESAQQILNEQGGALAIISPEPAFLTNIAGRYSDGKPDLDVYLKGHAADPIRSNRVSREEDDVPRACLTLCISPQPSVVAEMGAVDGWIDRGGAARLLPAFPDTSMIGYRDLEPPPIPDDLRTDWRDLVYRCLKLAPRAVKRDDGRPAPPEPHALTLTADARPVWRAFREWLEAEMRPGGAFGTTGLDSWGDKMGGAVLRIAGLLHCATHAVPQDAEIAASTIAAAITIGRHFQSGAVVMYAMSGRSRYGIARSTLEALALIEGECITERDFFQRVKNRAAFPTVDSLRPVLAMLEEHGWIRLEHHKPSIGRPSVLIHLHPDLQSQKPQNPTGEASSATFETFETVIPGTGHSRGNVTPLRPTGTEGAFGEDF